MMRPWCCLLLSSSLLLMLLYRVSGSGSSSVRDFQILTSKEIKERLEGLAEEFPNLVTLESAQEAFGLPAAGGSSKKQDCPFDESHEGCANWFITILDRVAHAPSSDSLAHLPDVLLSGALHGNERVGPTAVTETATLLLKAAHCEALQIDTTDTTDPSRCQQELRDEYGLEDVDRKWLARLVTTRRIVVVPSANALGYFRNQREEDFHIDPNRDFPFDVEHPNECMRTIAGRTLNELYRQSLVQLGLTFHGGMEVVAYEWGAPSYLNYDSPDDLAQTELAQAYSNFGGSFQHTKAYDYGTMNDKVYYVRGGMEDWAYAASWADPKQVLPCTPSEYGGYDVEKTTYNESMLRVFNMLVETSNDKEPHHDTLGSTQLLVQSDSPGTGHVSRNIRLALLAIDIVEPYVAVQGVNDVLLEDDVVPLTFRNHRNCRTSKTIQIPANQESANIRWTVGGGFTVDSTWLVWGKWEDVDTSINGMDQPLNPSTFFTKNPSFSTTPMQSGTGQFHRDGPQPKHENGDAQMPIFEASIDVSHMQAGETWVVFAGATLDQSWTTMPNNPSPDIAPQSHLVNARTNPSWHHESAGKIIQGRTEWYSIPLTLTMSNNNLHNDTVELSERLNPVIVALPSDKDVPQGEKGFSDDAITKEASSSSSILWMGVMGSFIGMIGIIFLIRRKQRYTHLWNNGLQRQRYDHELDVDVTYDTDEEELEFHGKQRYTDNEQVELPQFTID